MGISGSLAAEAVPTKTLDNYVQHVWQLQDGLPEANIQALVQTPDHYLWIGTTGGLLRFDGENFVLYNHDNTPAFHVDGVASLMVSRSGDLWIGTFGGGLIRYRSGQFRSYLTSSSFAGGFVRSLLEDRSGRIWVGTYDGLFFLEHDHIVRFKCSTKLSASSIFAMVEELDGTIWLGGSQLLQLKNGSLTAVPLPKRSDFATIKSLNITSDNSLWIGTESSLFHGRIDVTDHLRQLSQVRGIASGVRAIHLFPDGTLWIGTIAQGIFIYGNRKLQHLSTPTSLPSSAIFSIFRDIENNIWIGTQAGLVRLTLTEIFALHLPHASDAEFQTIYSDPKGPLWVASENLFRIESDTFHQVSFRGLQGIRICNLLRSRDGSLWIGTYGDGVFRLKNNRLAHYSIKNDPRRNFIRALLESRDGSIWIGSDTGLNRWHAGKMEKIGGPPGSNPITGIHVLYEDRHGNIWIGADQGLFVLRMQAEVASSVTGVLQNIPVWAIHEDPRGDLWLGTIGRGLFRWRAGEIIDFSVISNQLPRKILCILEDANQRLWMSSPNGIWVVRTRDLNSIANGSRQKPSIRFYGASEGVLTTQMFGGLQPAGASTKDGHIWFPSISGPVRVSPATERSVAQIPIVIDRVVVDGRELTPTDNIKLGTSGSHLEIDYGAVVLRSQKSLRFRYKLDGFDEQWVEAGTRRVAYYTNIPPGKHRLRAAVYSRNAPDVISQASLSLARRPFFYHTAWFYACCTLFVLGIIGTLQAQRTRRLHERFATILQERSRIAREMHDTLIQGCTSVSSALEALSTINACSTDETKSLLDSARLQISSTIEETRQAVWGLRRDEIRYSDLAKILQEVAIRTQQQFHIPINYQTLGKRCLIDQEKSHQLIMVTREALSNAVRHSDPTEVRLTVHYERDQIQIKIADDGHGFAACRQVVNVDRKHYGLSIMRERIAAIGGDLEIASIPGVGTHVIITAPMGRPQKASKDGV